MDRDPGLRSETSVQWPWSTTGLLGALAVWLMASVPPSANPAADWVGYRIALDLNTADHGRLEVLPQVGPRLASRIAEGRANRPYRSIADLESRVRGVGPKTAGRIAPNVRFAGQP